ncbi:MAG: hypothetical protein CSA62_08550 [Planctomycetota bacterium]|nr:MAG: hypothetical protein CSA62_08550 [Planctomycetota bacterium]
MIIRASFFPLVTLFSALALGPSEVLGQGVAEQEPRTLTPRSSIDLRVLGEEGRDWFFEPCYHEARVDDRGVLYLRKGVRLALSVARGDRGPRGDRAVGKAQLRYEWAPDGVAGPYIGEHARGKLYREALDPWAAKVDGESLLRAEGWGPGSFGPRASKNQRRLRGIRCPGNELVQALHLWQDDSVWFAGKPNAKVRASDGLRLLIVVEPSLPLLRIEAREYFTTSPRAYHDAHGAVQTSYMSEDGIVHIRSWASVGVEYAIQAKGAPRGKWRTCPASLSVRDLLGQAEMGLLLLRYQGRPESVRMRRLVIESRAIGKVEREGSGPLLLSGKELAVTKRILRSGRNVAAQAYREVRDLAHYQRDDRRSLDHRGGFRETSRLARSALRRALIAFVEGIGPRGCREARRAVRELLAIGTVDPLGMENPLWFANPCLERVTLGFEQGEVFRAAIAYGLLHGLSWQKIRNPLFTPVQDRKIRDGLASFARVFMQFRDNVQAKPGEGDAHWGAAMDVALMHLAAAMPSYHSPLYGEAGPGSSSELGPMAFPRSAISWWDFATEAEGRGLAWPEPLHGSRLAVVYSPAGIWRGPRRYERLLMPFALSAAILLEHRGEARLCPNVRAYALGLSPEKHPLAAWPGFGRDIKARSLGKRRLRDPLILLRSYEDNE